MRKADDSLGLVNLGVEVEVLRPAFPLVGASRQRKNSVSPRLLKKAQVQGGVTHPCGWVPAVARGVLGPYVAAPRERANAADGPFSAAY